MLDISEIFVTVVGFHNYYGLETFKVGNYLYCKKEPENEFDDEAVAVYACGVKAKLGYIANSYASKAKGTVSAGRLYDKFTDGLIIKVCFITKTKVICCVCLQNEGEKAQKMHFAEQQPVIDLEGEHNRAINDLTVEIYDKNDFDF